VLDDLVLFGFLVSVLLSGVCSVALVGWLLARPDRDTEEEQ
jgi:hypothetical protein